MGGNFWVYVAPALFSCKQVQRQDLDCHTRIGGMVVLLVKESKMKDNKTLHCIAYIRNNFKAEHVFLLWHSVRRRCASCEAYSSKNISSVSSLLHATFDRADNYEKDTCLGTLKIYCTGAFYLVALSTRTLSHCLPTNSGKLESVMHRPSRQQSSSNC